MWYQRYHEKRLSLSLSGKQHREEMRRGNRVRGVVVGVGVGADASIGNHEQESSITHYSNPFYFHYCYITSVLWKALLIKDVMREEELGGRG